ncbi:hypothetical protein BDW02DRAFT_547090 [Decorospora gaudefroyi]|uniref:J domain-containing protein n=1 Tax=Decorospora gaudefroyi TaxID=184978 RepID=A0A6A5KJ73_9PLEO|nr:hypothetical protein BDW02DRAFT_547090 [Decorospora gaudefroyi]
MPTHKSYFRTLGLVPTATEGAVRTAFRRLALIYHPDKADARFDEANTARFREIYEAYEYCLSHLNMATMAEDDEEAEEEDTTDWRAKLPDGNFGFNTAWCDELTGDEPEPIKQWAEACRKAERSSFTHLDETERYLLDTEYMAAYEGFEKWRRKHVEKPEQKARLQDDINSMPNRLRGHAREALRTKRSTPGYKYDDGYQDDYDEEQHFYEWEAVTDGESRPTGTWRDLHNASVTANITPQHRLALFKKQVAALKQRNSHDASAHPSARNETERLLTKEVDRDEKAKREAEIKKKLAKSITQNKKLGSSSEVNAALLEDTVPDEWWQLA